MQHTINPQWCKGCGICVAFCPKQALSLNAAEKAQHDPAKCVYCGLCEQYCPDLAIEVEKPVRKNAQSEGAV